MLLGVNMTQPELLVVKVPEVVMEPRKEELKRPVRQHPQPHRQLSPQQDNYPERSRRMRKGQAKIRKVLPDAIYGNNLVSKLVNRSMRDGKKSVAQREIYGAFEIVKEKSGEDAMKVFTLALDKIKPTMEVRPRRVGGAAYQVPMSVRGVRSESLAIRWLIGAANSRSNSEYHSYAEKLAAEIMDASKGEGSAVKKRTDMERVAEANRAFAHFRW